MKTEITFAKIFVVATAVMLAACCAVPARAGVLRYFMHGGARQLALGGVSLLDPGTSDFAPGHPALDTDRPDRDLRLTFEFEDIARTSEGGVPTSNVSARNAQRELVFTKRAPGRRFTLLAKTQEVNTSSADYKNNGYFGSHGTVESLSFGVRLGRVAFGAGRTNDSSDLSGFSDWMNEIFNSNQPPDIRATADQPEKFIELAAFPRNGVQLFYKKVWGGRSASIFTSFANSTNAYWLTLPFALNGGGRALGLTARIGEKWNITFVNMRNSYAGSNKARLDYLDKQNNSTGTDEFGSYTTAAETSSTGIEFAYDRSSATRLFFGARREKFEGVYDGFFADAPGEYNIDAYLLLRPTIYHIALEKDGALYGVKFRTGFQFGPMNPEGAVATLGKKCTFLSLYLECKTYSHTEREFPYTSVTQRALTMGLEYKIGSFTVAYSVGQMFPRAVRRREKGASGGAHGGEGVQAKGKEGRGGTLHMFSLDYAF